MTTLVLRVNFYGGYEEFDITAWFYDDVKVMLPCPFCGGDHSIDLFDNEPTNYCPECGAKVVGE